MQFSFITLHLILKLYDFVKWKRKNYIIKMEEIS